MDDAATLIQRLTARYRRRLMLRAAAGAALGLSCAGLLAMRLHQSGMEPAYVAFISGGALGLVAAWQWWSIRRDRWQRVKVVSDLDRALGLNARLLTAVEFANAPNPPVLYSRLLEETAKALPDIQRRFPPALDRPGAVLAVVALVLLLWPQANARLQLTMSPPPSLMPPAPPMTEPGNPAELGGRGNPEDGVRGTNNQDQQQQSGSQSKQSKGGGSQDQQQTQQQQQSSGSSGDQSPPSKESQANQSQQHKSQSGKESQQQQQAQAGKDASPQMAKTGKSEGAKSGSLSDAAQQQALKADIQQLLKELSSELKELQADMDAKQSNSNEPSPLAGGATDPNLYEQSAKLDKASGSRLPIQLEVDTKPTTSPRKGSGTGQPSKQASDALPQQEPESASLSDVRTTEQGQARHGIPPEYQPVFERLSPNER